MKRINLTKEQRELIKKSIYEKWIPILLGTGVDLSADNCPLCQKYAHTNNCLGCPIALVTDIGGCKSTPYDNWLRLGGRGKTAYNTDLKKAALEEIQFLQSIRDNSDEITKKEPKSLFEALQDIGESIIFEIRWDPTEGINITCNNPEVYPYFQNLDLKNPRSWWLDNNGKKFINILEEYIIGSTMV